MQRLNLFIMDISSPESTSGVDRYIEMLLYGMKNTPNIHIHWIHFLYNSSLIIYKEEKYEYYTKTTFPLPVNYRDIISEKFWMRKYNKHIFHLIEKMFLDKENCIIHLHTLNLIDLAQLIKEHVRCKIITHLHCIPWKNYFNTDRYRFNSLYQMVCLSTENEINSHDFLTNNCEYESYTCADHIITGTQCGVDFLVNVMGISPNKISIVNNGMFDHAKEGMKNNIKDTFPSIQCLFVGNLSESKGLRFVLDALRIVQRNGFQVVLKIAGFATPVTSSRILNEYSDLKICLLGVQSFEQLAELYKKCDIGIIASLQEQWSFVAVEMAMFSLPIITTAVDGLDEIFTDNINALKVDLYFDSLTGLTVDVAMMAEKLSLLIEDNDLRAKLSRNVRLLFEAKLDVQNMIKKTVAIYQELT